MSVAKTIEISSDSDDSFDLAIRSGITKASMSVDNITQVWIKDQIVLVKDGKIKGYRVRMNVTASLE